LQSADEQIAVPIVVIEEHLLAWLAQIRRVRDVHRQVVPYARLGKLLDFLLGWPIIVWNEAAADHFQRLRADRIRIGSQDLKIACIALASDAQLLSTARTIIVWVGA
jgi:tRNA(fMet)-specific endonuclease VapC